MVLTLSAAQPIYAATNPQETRFTPTPCMAPIPPGVIEGKDIVCGYINVPERHAEPDGPQIKLAIVVIKSQNIDNQSDPLFMAQGGPGGSTIDTYLELLLTQDRLVNNRDIVLFDQRGTLYSDPSLQCPEIDQLIRNTLDLDLSDEESERLDREATQACRDRLSAQGIDLSAYNSLENAADIVAIANELAYNQINLYGVSYGTLLALHTMRNHPEILRSVILDAVVPPQNNFILEVAQSADRSFTQLFESCLQDSACNKTYPDLENVLFNIIEKLDEEPVFIELVDPETGETFQALIDGETFQWGVFQLLYATSLIPALPRMIYDAQAGDFDFFARIMGFIILDRTTSYGMYYSVLCAEDADYDLKDQNLDNIRPQIAESEKDDPRLFQETCALWDVQSLGPDLDLPVSSDIPTLILSGEYDPITPPAYGQIVADNLVKGYHYTFPSGGHGQALEGECQNQIIQTFLDNPETPPDNACIADISRTDFISPRNTIDLPKLGDILNLEGTIGFEFLVLVITTLALLSSLFFFPLAWLFRKLKPSKKVTNPIPDQHNISIDNSEKSQADSAPHETDQSPITDSRPHLLVRFASWIAAANAILIASFLTAIISILFSMIIENDTRLFFGITTDARLWFIIPMISLVLTICMLVGTVLIWRRKRRTMLWRLYFTAITLSAIINMLILQSWGLLFGLV